MHPTTTQPNPAPTPDAQPVPAAKHTPKLPVRLACSPDAGEIRDGDPRLISDKISQIQQAVSQFGFSAVVASKDLVIVRNKKGQDCANVTATVVEQKYAGAKNLCGSLVRNAINSAIK